MLAKAHFVLQRSKLQGQEPGGPGGHRRGGRDDPPGGRRARRWCRPCCAGDVLEISSQPIVNLADGRIVSREMLIRGPEGPLRRPDNLFRFCQEKDILHGGGSALPEAVRRGRRPPGRRAADYHVNIMPATLLQTQAEELIRVLQRQRATTGTAAWRSASSSCWATPRCWCRRVRALQEAGIRIAIDDVGFGNSCLEGLIMLQPQVMKVDKRLVRGLAVDPEMRQALTRLLKVAEVLGAEVVAEGIENTEDYHVLLDMGVHLGQGYLFGRPCLCAEDPV